MQMTEKEQKMSTWMDDCGELAAMVHPLFVANDWKWVGEVPTVCQIQGHIWSLLMLAKREIGASHEFTTSSGRITVRLLFDSYAKEYIYDVKLDIN